MPFTVIPARVDGVDGNDAVDINTLYQNTKYFKDVITVTSGKMAVNGTPTIDSLHVVAVTSSHPISMFRAGSSNCSVKISNADDSVYFGIAAAGLGGIGFDPNVDASSLFFDLNDNVIVGTTSLGTTDTDGFFYIPGSAGPPTGAPTAYAGRFAMTYDSTNNDFYIYDGGWKGVPLIAGP